MNKINKSHLIAIFFTYFLQNNIYAGNGICTAASPYVNNSTGITLTKLMAISPTTTKLDVSNTELTAEQGMFISERFRNLTHLNLYECSTISAQGLVYLLEHITPTITHFNLGYTELSSSALEAIVRNFPLLFYLSIVGYKGDLAPLVENIPNTVRHLYLSYTNITTREVLEIIHKLPLLQSLSLSGCKRIQPHELVELLLQLPPSITYLDLEDIDLSTDACLEINAEHMPRLRHLSIKDQFNITGDILTQFLAQLPIALKSLNISGTRLNFAGLLILERFTELEYLDISSCRQLSCEAVTEGLAHLPQSLKGANITGINLSQRGLRVFAHRFQNCQLIRVCLGGCWNIPTKDINMLLSEFPQTITHLKISSTHLDDAGLERIRERLVRLVKLRIHFCFNVSNSYNGPVFEEDRTLPLSPFIE